MAENTKSDELHELLKSALDHELPEGAEERCLLRITSELKPLELDADELAEFDGPEPAPHES